MSRIRSTLAKPLAKIIAKRHRKWQAQALDIQEDWREKLVRKAQNTAFGRDHGFGDIHSYEDWKAQVPIRDYEGLKPYVERAVKGEKDVLYPGLPLYFAKTSGTTSGVKYIPITKDSISNHIGGARDALLHYIAETGKARFLDGKLIFLSGSPTLDTSGPVAFGRLSGIVNHHVPSYLRSNQMPSYETNCIEDWEQKLEKIIDETLPVDMSLISGIPPWVQMYLDRIVERTGKSAKELWPQLEMYVYGGVNFAPYRQKLFESLGATIPSIETFPASEGFIAFQTEQEDPGLQLLVNSGIFFEFVPAEKIGEASPPRLSLAEVEVGVNYALILSNNAGLWAYNIGDMVKFTSLSPYKLVVAGRVKHFISAFGEHVIGEEVEKAMTQALQDFPETEIVEFTVAPQVTPSEGLPHHQWFIEFAKQPYDLESFATRLDQALVQLNSYYKDLIDGKILRTLIVSPVRKGAFVQHMRDKGKLGGQNKVPRLSNDRSFVEGLEKFAE